MTQEIISMKELLEAGVYFGHKVSNWNPKMKNYIFIKRRGVHIINLQKTLLLFEQAYNLVKNITASGGKILFVGTKKQAQKSIRDHATRANQYYINHHWVGGLLTNFAVVKQSINKIDKFRNILADERAKKRYLKRDLLKIEKSLKKLEEAFIGVKEMKKLPDLLFVVDSHVESRAISEANIMGIPVCAMVDTNSDPDGIDIIIPSNDDTVRAIDIFVSRTADASLDGKKLLEVTREETLFAQEKSSTTDDDLPTEESDPATAQQKNIAPATTSPNQKLRLRVKSNSTTPAPTNTATQKQATQNRTATSQKKSKPIDSTPKSPSQKTSTPPAPNTQTKEHPAKPLPQSSDRKASQKNSPPQKTPPSQTTPQPANVSAQLVKELRDITQAGMMECKAALTQAKGNKDEAIRILKEKGMLLAEKKNASRDANEGIIFIAQSSTRTVAVQCLSETDFVAKNEDFKTFVKTLGTEFLAKGKTFLTSNDVTTMISDIVSKLREKIVIGENITIEHAPNTITGFYLHGNHKIAALTTATIDEKDLSALNKDALTSVLKDVCMQIAAMNPIALSVADIDDKTREQERQIFLKQLKTSDKKPELVDKIVDGKLKKYFSERCLLEMSFVKDPKLSVKKYLTTQAKSCGLSAINLTAMHRLEIGKS